MLDGAEKTFREKETALYWRACLQLRDAVSGGSSPAIRWAVEELEAFAMHTRCAGIRRGAMGALRAASTSERLAVRRAATTALCRLVPLNVAGHA